MRPYIIDLPARGQHFYGRERLVKTVLEKAWTWLCAQRRMGKTSLLYKIEEQARQRGVLPLLFDLSLIRDETNQRATGGALFRGFFAYHHRVRARLDQFGLAPDQFADMDAPECFRHLVERVQEHGHAVIILWDEAERLIAVEKNDPGFLEGLRAHLQGLEEFQFVLAGTQLLSTLYNQRIPVSLFLDTFAWVPIGGLEDEDAMKLLRCQQTGGWSSPLPEEIVGGILRFSGGHPLILQEIGDHLRDMTDFDGQRARPAMLQECCEDIVSSPKICGLIENDYAKLTGAQRVVLVAACRTDAPLDLAEIAAQNALLPAAVQQAARRLASYGYLSRGDRPTLRFQFYRRVLPPREPELLADPVKVDRIARRPVRIFYSYDSSDELFSLELEVHLKLLQRQQIIDGWAGRHIKPGEERLPEIRRQLCEADVILLLISPDFLASDHCWEQVTLAMQRSGAGTAHVIPVLVRPVELHGAPFKDLQVLPRNAMPVSTWSSRDEAWAELASELRQVAEAIHQRWEPHSG